MLGLVGLVLQLIIGLWLMVRSSFWLNLFQHWRRNAE
jgi:hypothetical protein